MPRRSLKKLALSSKLPNFDRTLQKEAHHHKMRLFCLSVLFPYGCKNYIAVLVTLRMTITTLPLISKGSVLLIIIGFIVGLAG